MKNIIILLAGLLSFLILSQQNIAGQNNPSIKLNDLFDEIKQYNDDAWGLDSLFKGFHVKEKFKPISFESIQEKAKVYSEFIDKLNLVPEGKLSRQEHISKEIMLHDLQHRVSMIKFGYFLIPFNAEGGFYNHLSWALNKLPFNREQDYEAYLHWLPFYVNYLNDYKALMQHGIASNIVAPKVIVNNCIAHLKQFTAVEIELSPLFWPFVKMPESIDSKSSKQLRIKAKAVISKQLIPVYNELLSFVIHEYYPVAKDQPGIKYIADGQLLYKELVGYYTTLDLSPDSIHQLGIIEVKRIRNQMEEIIKEVGFKGSFDEFLTFLRTDPQFYAKTPQELLYYSAWLSKKAEGQLPVLFNKLYMLPFTVEPVPDAIAPTYSGGRYVHGSMKRKLPGRYWVNTYKLESRPLYVMPALTVHESVPGHHLQISLATELEELPEFRQNIYFDAFGEGWGLYSEYLGEEMGMYTTPYERFGRYTYEMWRACRLVLDSGIHSKGWSRDEAVEFLKSNTALSVHEVNTEINRYIGWPGQAVSYKVGELKIKALRTMAENKLGNKFDIREFHYHVLKNGSVSLSILEQEIAEYIATKLEMKYPCTKAHTGE